MCLRPKHWEILCEASVVMEQITGGVTMNHLVSFIQFELAHKNTSVLDLQVQTSMLAWLFWSVYLTFNHRRNLDTQMHAHVRTHT